MLFKEEDLQDGWNVLVGCDKEKIIKMANNFEPRGEQGDVFGSGDASERITKIILEIFYNYTFALFILGIVLLLFKSAQEIGVI
jgi:UDP-N-acetylglucosamine 2-epimerase